MAKSIKTPKHNVGRTITTKSPFGSHKEMVVTDENILKQINVPLGYVLMQDDDGYYLTYEDRIDNNLADSLRYCMLHREKNLIQIQ